jgi:D-amino peptidase
MKIYISADIEGVTGSVDWAETEKKEADYAEFQEQMTAEVAAACEGAVQAGAGEIVVKDAHDSARNIIAAKLPEVTRLLRGWSGHPFMMMDGLDATFSAALMIGYHSRAGSNANPLAHTMSGSDLWVKINDRFASEFMINAYTAGLAGVPVAFVAGDAGLCEDAAGLIPRITTVAVKEGTGSSTLSIHPKLALKRIREGVQTALAGDLSQCQVKLPDHFVVEIRYRQHFKAYGFSFFPGASLVDPYTIRFEASEYMDVLRLFAFVF